MTRVTEGTYLAWYDAGRAKAPAQKIADAAARYREKFGAEPTVCLLSAAVAVDPAALVVLGLEGLALRPLPHIGAHCYWVGRDADPA